MKLPGFLERLSLSKLLALLFSLLFIISISSCTQEEGASEVAELPSDKDITETIRTQLNASDEVPADSINIETEQGIVTLRGSTSNLLAKREANQIAAATLNGTLDSQFEKEQAFEDAQDVKGVVAIKNNISIPSSNT